MSRRSPLAALRSDRVALAVAAVAVAAVLARLAGLGARVAHQDEARVGYWTLRYFASGRLEYRPIVHGPFIPVVDRHLFAVFGPSDFVARLPMAVLGGLLPAAALLFRTRLRDSETVALALLFAANPVMLYYSRFMRQDVPLAVFAVFALGFAVRAVDATGRRRRRYVYAAGLAFGLAATTKENVLLYPVAWLGALALVVDQRLLDAAEPFGAARGTVPDPPRPAVALPPAVRRAAPLAFLGASPPVAAVVGLDGLALGALVTAGAVAYYGAVRGGTVWHLLGGLPLLGVGALALVRSSFDPGLTTFAAGLAWLLAGLLLVDERVVDYGRRSAGSAVATDGGRADEDGDTATTKASPEAGSDTPEEATAAAAGERGDGEGVAGRLLPLPPLGVAFALAMGVIILFYAPRGGGYPAVGADLEGWGLWSALAAGSPEGVGVVLRAATYDVWTDFLELWAGGAQDHAYIPFFLEFLKTLRAGALTLTLAAVGGTAFDRYGEGREFVAFCAYWGFASVLGYPLVTDIAAPWTTIHALVALAVPAAVALAAVYRVGRAEFTAPDVTAPDVNPDWVVVAAAGVILVGACVQVGGAAVTDVYENPQSRDSDLVQYAQSSSTDMKPVLEDVRRVARENDGVDVLYYGDEFDAPNESAHDQAPAGPGWFERLPLAYYTEMYAQRSGERVVVDSTTSREDVRDSEAPVVVAFDDAEETTVPYSASEVAPLVENHSRYEGQRFLYDGGVRSSIVYFVDTRGLERPASVYVSGGPRLRPALAIDRAAGERTRVPLTDPGPRN